MFVVPIFLISTAFMLFVIGFMSFDGKSSRPTLQMESLGIETPKKKRKGIFGVIRKISGITKPIISRSMHQRISKDIMFAHSNLSVEEFIFIKLVMVGFIMFLFFSFTPPEMLIFNVLLAVGVGWVIPEFWMKGRIKRIKSDIVRELPDAVDLLGLCVNAGLDFMMALKWVVEKSRPSVVVDELNTLLQEISVGKPRRDALRDMARRYNLPDLSTFTRTLIQADRMGTSVSEALNILSEDMRLTRFRRGEEMALKAPMKMLVPLLFFIFPVVGILVGGPIFLDFMTNNPLKGMAN